MEFWVLGYRRLIQNPWSKTLHWLTWTQQREKSHLSSNSSPYSGSSHVCVKWAGPCFISNATAVVYIRRAFQHALGPISTPDQAPPQDLSVALTIISNKNQRKLQKVSSMRISRVTSQSELLSEVMSRSAVCRAILGFLLISFSLLFLLSGHHREPGLWQTWWPPAVHVRAGTHG